MNFDKELALILDNGRKTAICWDCNQELECYTNIWWAHTSLVAGMKCIAKFKSEELKFTSKLKGRI